jgi:pimeloyl-ACP methyl ester carboxylesterase
MKEDIVTLELVPIWTMTQGKGQPLMLCNGGPGFGDYLAPVAAMIDDLVQVHRWEQRGCGRSAAIPPYDHATCLADLERLREHFGYDRWIIGGHSWGQTWPSIMLLPIPTGCWRSSIWRELALHGSGGQRLNARSKNEANLFPSSPLLSTGRSIKLGSGHEPSICRTRS